MSAFVITRLAFVMDFGQTPEERFRVLFALVFGTNFTMQHPLHRKTGPAPNSSLAPFTAFFARHVLLNVRLVSPSLCASCLTDLFNYSRAHLRHAIPLSACVCVSAFTVRVSMIPLLYPFLCFYVYLFLCPSILHVSLFFLFSSSIHLSVCFSLCLLVCVAVGVLVDVRWRTCFWMRWRTCFWMRW